MSDPLQSILQCVFEIQECTRNQRRFPDESKLAMLGELDWRDELHFQQKYLFTSDKRLWHTAKHEEQTCGRTREVRRKGEGTQGICFAVQGRTNQGIKAGQCSEEG